ncbi:maltose alpha-D-glucosyltransferase [Tepidiforma sp.]|uniref:maltose alpha-D-glucosyltransferase n=1 Tax=Tepidiforma sp. TaxID=2682230 RepID=UPI002627D146|nr:maltose alpha-D-glucosyltransferase [Tepidiforma sp.]
MTRATASRAERSAVLTGDPLWYKDAVIYELHVRAFHDGNGDGVGDFAGLTAKLDYLQELGVTAVWLLPFYESPLRDDGYDIADYRKIHPAYGTLAEFKTFLREAHARGLRVITELVVNHTSDQHPWFQRARRAPKGSAYRNYYVWSDTAAEYADARIIFKDFERSNWTWDPVAGQYYWHRFYSHQPDLNFENPRVRREIMDVADFWLELGVDGFRLDAVPYLFEAEGTTCENLPPTHAFLKELRAHVDAKFPGRMLLAEANQWPEDAVAYFGNGDECHMAFHFPLMPRLFMSVRMEDRFPTTEILEQTPPIPETCQWALFLRNHDELTLEMVTDEERDYMYRVYAAEDRARVNLGIRRRLAPLLANNRRLIELLNALLFSLNGTPVIYYGDEIGMGDNIYLGDRDSVRTPMQWSADRNAGFSRANPQKLYLPVIIDPEYHYESVNVDAQQANPSSLLWWMRRLIGLRRRHPAFARGSLQFVECDNHRVLAFVREYAGERLLVVANLSRFAQAAHLSLGAYAGTEPVELFGNGRFPRVGSEPYFLSLGPHSFYWFELAAPGADGRAEPVLPEIAVDVSPEEVFDGRRAALDAVLAEYVPARRWFGGLTRRPRRVRVADRVPLRARGLPPTAFAVVLVEYEQGEPDQFGLLLSLVPEGRRGGVEAAAGWAVAAEIRNAAGERWLLVDGLALPEVCGALPGLFRARTRLAGERGGLVFVPEPGARFNGVEGMPVLGRAEQSNTSVHYPGQFVFKAIRRLEPGVHPQVELGELLAKTPAAGMVPRLAGYVEYVRDGARPAVAAVIEAAVPHQYDAWTFATEQLERMLEEVAAARLEAPKVSEADHPLELGPAPEGLAGFAGGWLEFAETLGRRTAELHAALAGIAHPDFAPERYTPFYQRALAQGFRVQARRSLRALRRCLPTLSAEAVALAGLVLEKEPALLERLQQVARRKLESLRIRCHGDLHLGQVLVNGREPVFIDFEGEPARSLGERRLRRSPLRDVAGMVRSFHYASRAGLRQVVEGHAAGTGTDLERWALAWYLWTSRAYLDGYFAAARANGLPGGSDEEHRFLLDTFVLDKAFYELGYELDHRPDWAEIPLRGLLLAAAQEGL